jgi:hypothetical protein
MRLPWLFLVLTVWSTNTLAVDGAPSDPDGRINLGLTPEERAEFLAEMRQMLTSVQGIIAGLGSGDRARVMEAARYSGNRMARATPDALRSRLPSGFKDIGGPTHMMFEELIVRAEADDTETLLSYTGEMLQQCLACHALFRAH